MLNGVLRVGFIYNHPRQVEIKASPDKIRQQAQQAKLLCERLLEHMKIIESKIGASSYFWRTDSSQLLYRYYDEDKLDYDKIRNQLNAQIERLNEIANAYDNAERASLEAASALPEAVIE